MPYQVCGTQSDQCSLAVRGRCAAKVNIIEQCTGQRGSASHKQFTCRAKSITSRWPDLMSAFAPSSLTCSGCFHGGCTLLGDLHVKRRRVAKLLSGLRTLPKAIVRNRVYTIPCVRCPHRPTCLSSMLTLSCKSLTSRCNPCTTACTLRRACQSAPALAHSII